MSGCLQVFLYIGCVKLHGFFLAQHYKVYMEVHNNENKIINILFCHLEWAWIELTSAASRGLPGYFAGQCSCGLHSGNKDGGHF
jgi:hypothetical protein